MANQYGNQFSYSKVFKKWTLYATINIGATGAPTFGSLQAMGFSTITRNSAGKYTLVLTDTWKRLLCYDIKIKFATAPAAPLNYLVSETVATAATKNIVIQFTAVDGTTATDPDSGTVVFLKIELDN